MGNESIADNLAALPFRPGTSILNSKGSKLGGAGLPSQIVPNGIVDTHL